MNTILMGDWNSVVGSGREANIVGPHGLEKGELKSDPEYILQKLEKLEDLCDRKNTEDDINQEPEEEGRKTISSS